MITFVIHGCQHLKLLSFFTYALKQKVEVKGTALKEKVEAKCCTSFNIYNLYLLLARKCFYKKKNEKVGMLTVRTGCNWQTCNLHEHCACIDVLTSI